MRNNGALKKGSEALETGAPSMVELIESLFFAYRDFVGDADRLLETYKFGRAHHRALHFVNRRPGLTIAELLEILQITKQSLNRVLRDLVRSGFIDARPGPDDRRERRLHVTAKGASLAEELIVLQSGRLKNAVAGIGPGGDVLAKAFLDGVSNRKPVL
jgi:DNA-binding MarR family transcriptional regulator